MNDAVALAALQRAILTSNVSPPLELFARLHVLPLAQQVGRCRAAELWPAYVVDKQAPPRFHRFGHGIGGGDTPRNVPQSDVDGLTVAARAAFDCFNVAQLHALGHTSADGRNATNVEIGMQRVALDDGDCHVHQLVGRTTGSQHRQKRGRQLYFRHTVTADVTELTNLVRQDGNTLSSNNNRVYSSVIQPIRWLISKPKSVVLLKYATGGAAFTTVTARPDSVFTFLSP